MGERDDINPIYDKNTAQKMSLPATQPIGKQILQRRRAVNDIEMQVLKEKLFGSPLFHSSSNECLTFTLS